MSMLYSEFCEKYSCVPVSGDGYSNIEKAYYGWYGDKDQFCYILTVLSDNFLPETVDSFLATCYYADRNNDALPYRYSIHADDYDNGISISCKSMYRFELSALVKAKELNHTTAYSWIVFDIN